MRDLGYEVWLLPGLWAAWAVTVLWLLGCSFRRTAVETAPDGAPLRRTVLVAGGLRRAGVVFLAGLLLLPAIVVTPPRHRTVIYSAVGGVLDAPRPEGVSFVVPWVQTPVSYDVGLVRWYSEEVYAQSIDLQEITVVVSVNHRLDPDATPDLHRRLGRGYADILITPMVQHVVKREVGLVRAADFAQNRQVLADAVQAELEAVLVPWGIVPVVTAIEDAIFDPDFIAAIKAKVIADERAAEQQRLVAMRAAERDQVEITADAERIRRELEARGERAAIEQVVAALDFNAEQYLQWLLLQQWNGELPTTLVGSADPLGLLLEIAPE